MLKKFLVEESIEIENKGRYRFFYTLIYFFKYEYILITIFIREKVSHSKLNMLILIFFRFLIMFYLIAFLSPENSKSGTEDISAEGYEYNNKDLACAVITILLFEIPYVIIETALKKKEVSYGDSFIKK